MDIALKHIDFLNDLSNNNIKTTEEQIKAFFRTYEHGHTKLLPFSKFMVDSFHVNLDSLSDAELMTLHQYTKWVAPSYWLRKRYIHNLSNASEKLLLCLVQSQSSSALTEWKNRYVDNVEKAPDELLVLLYKAGNSYAREILTMRHKQYIIYLIVDLKRKGRFFRGMNDEDVIQESMIGLLKAIKDYKIERKMKFLVFARFVIVKYLDTIINQSKNTKNSSLNDSYSFHAPISSDAEMTFEESFESEVTTPDELAIKKDTLLEIWNILTPLEQSVLIFYTEGYRYEEIGVMIDKDKKAVDNTIQRIRTKGENYEKMLTEIDKQKR